MPLTDQDKIFLSFFEDDICFTRVSNNILFATRLAPHLEEEEWQGETDNPDTAFIELKKDVLKAVTWESQQAWSVKELLTEME